jgi:hypothetical protein
LSLSTWFFFVPFLSLSKLEGINMILTRVTLPWASNNGSSHYIIKTSLLIHVTSSLWFNRDWHLEICDSPWLVWYLGFKHPLALLHHIRYLDAKTPLALLRCMVHRSEVHVNPSSTNIMIHTYLHVFDKLTFVTLCYVDVDEYVFMSSNIFKVLIDMRHRWLTLFLLFHLMTSSCHMAYTNI